MPRFSELVSDRARERTQVSSSPYPVIPHDYEGLSVRPRLSSSGSAERPESRQIPNPNTPTSKVNNFDGSFVFRGAALETDG